MIGKRHLLATALALVPALAACGGGTNFGAERGKRGGDGSKPADKEGEKADVPEMVSGSFLTCEIIGEEHAGGVPIGCAGYVDSKKLAHSCGFSLALTHDSRPIPMVTSPTGTGSPWHMLGDLPKRFLKEEGVLHLHADCANQTMTQKTTELNQLGGQSAGKVDDVPAFQLLASFPTLRRWDARSAGYILDGIVAADFCDDGEPADEIQGKTSRAMIDGTENLFEGILGGPVGGMVSDKLVDPKIPRNTTPVPLSGIDKCPLRKFDLIQYRNGFPDKQGDKQYAHASLDGCLYVRVGNALHITKVDTSKGLTLDNLRRSAAAAGCH